MGQKVVVSPGPLPAWAEKSRMLVLPGCEKKFDDKHSHFDIIPTV